MSLSLTEGVDPGGWPVGSAARSQEIPGYPQAFQESWKSSHGLTQTRRGRVFPGPGGPRRHGGIYWAGPMCAGGAEGGPCAVRACLRFPAALSEEEPCFCAALPSFQNLRKVFSVAVSPLTAGSESQQQSPGSSGLGSAVFPAPDLSATWRGGVWGGGEPGIRSPRCWLHL